MRDLVVVGGGPSGLGTALHAAARGMSVTVVERRRGVVDKACGEGLMPGGLEHLRALGVDPPGRPLAGIRYVAGGRAATARFSSGAGRGVRRTTLHRALLDAADRAGVDVVTAEAGPLTQDDSGVQVAGVRARWAVAADGLHSPVRRALGLDRPVRGRRRYGVRTHVAVAPWTDHVEVHWSDGSEAYVTPVEDGLVGVAVLTERRAPLSEHLRAFPVLAAQVDARGEHPVLGAGPLRQRSARRVAGRVLLVGDAAGYVDALTGEGVSLGLAQAGAAVDALAGGDPAAYEVAWRRVTRRYALLTGALLAASRQPSVRRVLVPAAGALPAVFGAAVDALARPA